MNTQVIDGQSCLYRFASTGERRVARKLVYKVLQDGHTISLHDGGEWTVRHSHSASEVLEALCTTGEDRLRVRDADGMSVGSFWLVWGNLSDGSELISDHSDTEYCTAVARWVNGEDEED